MAMEVKNDNNTIPTSTRGKRRLLVKKFFLYLFYMHEQKIREKAIDVISKLDTKRALSQNKKIDDTDRQREEDNHDVVKRSNEYLFGAMHSLSTKSSLILGGFFAIVTLAFTILISPPIQGATLIALIFLCVFCGLGGILALLVFTGDGRKEINLNSLDNDKEKENSLENLINLRLWESTCYYKNMLIYIKRKAIFRFSLFFLIISFLALIAFGIITYAC